MAARSRYIAAAALLALLALPAPAAPAPRAAASPARPSAPVVLRLELSPPDLRLYGAGASEQVYVSAVLAGGEVRDVTPDAAWSSTAPAVARAAAGGNVRAAGDGRATVRVQFRGRSAFLPVTVSGAARPRPVSFLYEVLPALTRAGCNQGTCHGNAEGRGGLKLSLKGEDPEGDLAALVRLGGGRRVNRAEPGASLLLLKATLALPHGGGRRFTPDSEPYRTLAGWIAEGAALDPPGSPRLARLEVTPRERVLSEPARMQRLTVRGHFTDGTIRNLADRAVYNSGDPLTRVTEDGKVLFDRDGDVAVLVRYADRMEHARITCVAARPGFAWRDVPAANFIDSLNYPRLKLLRLQPSALSGDTEFLRRAYLDAIGLLPTPDEVRAFQADRRPDRRARLIDALLQRPEFTDFWTLKWSDLLRVEERTLDPKGAAGYREWIRASIAAGKPLDQFARELITASGSTYENPPANYYRRTRIPIELSETTAQVFMGVRIGCAKCHNHPFEAWKQEDYYSLAAFFARVGRKGEFTRKDRFDKHELIGEETISVAAEGEVLHPRTDLPVAPRLPFAAAPAVPGPDGDRRAPFATWLTDPGNPFFARAMANRIWYHLVGRGIVEPVDDLRASNPPANPELLDALARELVTHRFDLRHLVRTIMNSRTYQLSSDPNATNAGDERFFSRAITGRLGAEVLLDALSQATSAPEQFAGYPDGTRAVHLIPVNKVRHPFLKLFGQPARESACECERTDETTLGQSFALISGAAVDAKLRLPGNRIGRLMGEGRPDPEIVSELYLATVSREPTSRERDEAGAYVAGRSDRRAAFEDLLWALLNSKEFLLRR